MMALLDKSVQFESKFAKFNTISGAVDVRIKMLLKRCLACHCSILC